MKRIMSVVVVMVVCFGLTSAAQAGFSWNGFAGPPTAYDLIHLKFDNWEYTIDWDGVDAFGNPTVDAFGNPTGPAGTIIPLANSVGDEIRGIIRITSIDSDAGTHWVPQTGPNEGELTGAFWGYTVTSMTPHSPTNLNVTFGGGIMGLWYDEGMTNQINPSYAAVPDGTQDPIAGPTLAHGNGFSDGLLFLGTTGVGGIVSPDPLPMGLPIVLDVDLDVSTTIGSGDGEGYLQINAGFAAGMFGPDAYDPGGLIPGSQDLYIVNNIVVQGAFPGADADPTNDDPTTWPVFSHDPVEGLYIPEPASLIVWGLLGICAAGLGVIRRKK